MTAQTVRTERLLLRPIAVEDAGAIAAIYADPEVARVVHGLDLDGTRAQLERWVREWHTRGLGTFAIVEAATGDFIGRAFAFANSDLEMITAIIAHGNDASVTVATRLGMEPWREQVMFGMECTIFAARRPVG